MPTPIYGITVIECLFIKSYNYEILALGTYSLP